MKSITEQQAAIAARKAALLARMAEHPTPVRPPTTTCPDCGVEIGETHWNICDVPLCPETGEQRLGCIRHHDCPPVVWTGND